MNKVWTAFGIAFASVIVAVAGLLLIFSKQPPTPHFYFLIDISKSSARNWECVANAIRDEYKKQKKFVLSLYVTGDKKSALEPVALASNRLVSDEVEWGQPEDAPQKAFESLLNDLEIKFKRLEPSDTSSIYGDIKRVVQQAQSDKMKDPEILCTVIVKSDLEELQEPQIVASLRAKVGARTPLPKPIDIGGLKEIVLLGAAETVGESEGKPSKGKSQSYTGPRTSERKDRQREVWTQLFSQSSLVRFEDFCSGRENLASDKNK